MLPLATMLDEAGVPTNQPSGFASWISFQAASRSVITGTVQAIRRGDPGGKLSSGAPPCRQSPALAIAKMEWPPSALYAATTIEEISFEWRGQARPPAESRRTVTFPFDARAVASRTRIDDGRAMCSRRQRPSIFVPLLSSPKQVVTP